MFISKFIAPLSGKTNCYNDTILSSISISKDNHGMKFGQVIEHEIENIFLRKS